MESFDKPCIELTKAAFRYIYIMRYYAEGRDCTAEYRLTDLMKKYRNEWKYCCTDADLVRVEHRIGAVLQKDVHAGENGRYGVHSLYFDDLNNTCAMETEAGNGLRFKYRIRYYGNNPDFLRLERKEKRYGGCFKASCRITRGEFEALTAGDVSGLLYDETKPLLRRFAADILMRGFTPRVIVDYERIAYVEPIANVHITLDLNIAVSKEYGRFLNGDYLKVPLLSKGRHVLEVKFDDVFPGYLKQSVYECNLQQRSFSKYGLGFELLRSM